MPKTPPSFLRRSPRRYTPPGLSPGNSPQQRLYTDTVKVMADDRTENVRRRLDIASKEVDDTAMIDLVADDLSKAYTFLKSQIRSVLCGIGRKWNRRGTGNKKEFLYRNILFLLDGKKAGRNIALMLQDNDACPSFDAFQAKSEETSLSYETCPSRNAIKEHFRSIGDPDEVSTLSGSVSARNTELGGNGIPCFSISEFACL